MEIDILLFFLDKLRKEYAGMPHGKGWDARVKGRRANFVDRRSPSAASPRVAAAPSSILDYVHITPPSYGSAKAECETKKHAWIERASRPDHVVVECATCKASGDIRGPDAQQKWEQLQEAMLARGKVA